MVSFTERGNELPILRVDQRLKQNSFDWTLIWIDHVKTQPPLSPRRIRWYDELQPNKDDVVSHGRQSLVPPDSVTVSHFIRCELSPPHPYRSPCTPCRGDSTRRLFTPDSWGLGSSTFPPGSLFGVVLGVGYSVLVVIPVFPHKPNLFSSFDTEWNLVYFSSVSRPQCGPVILHLRTSKIPETPFPVQSCVDSNRGSPSPELFSVKDGEYQKVRFDSQADYLRRLFSTRRVCPYFTCRTVPESVNTR